MKRITPQRKLGLEAFLDDNGSITLVKSQDNYSKISHEEIEEIAQAAEQWAADLRNLIAKKEVCKPPAPKPAPANVFINEASQIPRHK